MKFNTASLLLLTLFSCTTMSKGGKDVHYIESNRGLLQEMEMADKLGYDHDCQNLGIIHGRTDRLPPKFTGHENEIHASLRNEASTLGANVVIANFYQKPARGIALKCREDVIVLLRRKKP